LTPSIRLIRPRRPSDHAHSRTQITLSGVASGGHLGNQIAEHIGGSVRAEGYEMRLASRVASSSQLAGVRL
jgi:hypothetical protein